MSYAVWYAKRLFGQPNRIYLLIGAEFLIRQIDKAQFGFVSVAPFGGKVYFFKGEVLYKPIEGELVKIGAAVVEKVFLNKGQSVKLGFYAGFFADFSQKGLLGGFAEVGAAADGVIPIEAFVVDHKELGAGYDQSADAVIEGALGGFEGGVHFGFPFTIV